MSGAFVRDEEVLQDQVGAAQHHARTGEKAEPAGTRLSVVGCRRLLIARSPPPVGPASAFAVRYRETVVRFATDRTLNEATRHVDSHVDYPLRCRTRPRPWAVSRGAGAALCDRNVGCRLRPSAEQVTDDMDASHGLIARHLTSTRPGRGKIIIQYVVLCAFVAAKKLPDSCVLAILDRHEAIEDRDRSSAGGTGASCSLHTTRDNRAL